MWEYHQFTDSASTSRDSSRKGWIVLTLMCSFVPPSDELEPFLRRHLSQIAQDKTHPATATAQDCERRLQASKSFPRALPPNAFEIQALERGNSVEFQVSVADGSIQGIFLGHMTVASEVHAQLCDANSVTDREEFGLFMELSDGQSKDIVFGGPNQHKEVLKGDLLQCCFRCCRGTLSWT